MSLGWRHSQFYYALGSIFRTHQFISAAHFHTVCPIQRNCAGVGSKRADRRQLARFGDVHYAKQDDAALHHSSDSKLLEQIERYARISGFFALSAHIQSINVSVHAPSTSARCVSKQPGSCSVLLLHHLRLLSLWPEETRDHRARFRAKGDTTIFQPILVLRIDCRREHSILSLCIYSGVAALELFL